MRIEGFEFRVQGAGPRLTGFRRAVQCRGVEDGNLSVRLPILDQTVGSRIGCDPRAKPPKKMGLET